MTDKTAWEGHTERAPTIGATGEGVTGRSDCTTASQPIAGSSSTGDSPLTTTDRLPLPDCLYCGGNVSVAPMLPKGWNVRVHHKAGCAIEAMSGLRIDDEHELGRFTDAWNTRALPALEAERDALREFVNWTLGEGYDPRALRSFARQALAISEKSE